MENVREVKLVFDVDTGKCLGVDPPGKDRITPDEAGTIVGMRPDTIMLVDKPGKSICCIMHGGRLYCWC